MEPNKLLFSGLKFCADLVVKEYKKYFSGYPAHKKIINQALAELHKEFPDHSRYFDKLFAQRIVGNDFFDLIKKGQLINVDNLTEKYKASCEEKLQNTASIVCQRFVEIIANIILENTQLSSPYTNKLTKKAVDNTERILNRVEEYLVPQVGWTYSQWERFPEIYKYSFVSDDTLNELIKKIRAYNLANKIIRYEGSSGVGKTRIIYESFKGEDELSQNLRNKVIYLSTSEHSIQSIVERATQLRDAGADNILIVDDCTIELHTTLAKIADFQESKFKLLTIDFETSGSPAVLEIGRVSDEVIRKIINQNFPQLDSGFASKVIQFSQGYPVIAVKIASALVNNQDHDHNIDKVLIDKMLWQHDQPNSEGDKFIQVCSAFSNFGFTAEYKEELDFIIKLSGLSEQEFSRHLAYFEQRKIIQKHGRFVTVQPLPIAIRKATEFWKTLPVHMAVKIFEGNVAPDRLLKQMCQQLSMLDRLPNAKELVQNLCEGDHAPFGVAEVLNSDLGSECFRSLVVVNPESCMNALKKAFKDYRIDDYKNIDLGRRNIVWALEKLVFRSSCFHEAAKIMLFLAAAENETWANNATGQFKHLFQTFLAGTEVSLADRAKFIDNSLELNEPKIDSILVEAIGHALNISHFSRTLGAEEQGSSILKDYSPKSNEEIIAYLENMLGKLIYIINSKPHVSDAAIKHISSGSIRRFAAGGLLPLALASYKSLNSRRLNLLGNMLAGLNLALSYDKKDILEAYGEDYLKSVENALEDLWPQNLADEISVTITQENFELFREGLEVQDFDRAEKEYLNKLAKKVVQNQNEFFDVLPNVLLGAQCRAYSLGYNLAMEVVDYKGFLDRVLNIATVVQYTNPDFIKGFLAKLYEKDPDFVNSKLYELSDNDLFRKDVIYLISSRNILDKDFEVVLKILQHDHAQIYQLRYLGYGGVLKDVSADAFANFIHRVLQLSEESEIISLDLMSMYSYQNSERIKSLSGVLSNLLLKKSLLKALYSQKNSTMSAYYFGKLSSWMIENYSDALQFSKNFIVEIMDWVSNNESNYNVEDTISALFQEIISLYPDECWPLIAEKLISANPMQEFRLQHLLGDLFDKNNEQTVLNKINPDNIINWCKSNPDKAPEFIMSIISPLDTSKLSWNPVVRKIIDLFGSSQDVLSALSRNINSFSSWGDVSNYYSMYLGPLQDLLGHENLIVREWAGSNLKSIEHSISRERQREAERNIGII